MKTMDNPVQVYWERNAREFDSLYGTGLQRLVNNVFRKALFKRMDIAVEECRGIANCSVLDVGCGSGRGSVALALGGVSRCVGVDFSPSMIELARGLAKQHGVADRCEFQVADILSANLEQQFDVSVALGVFDYVAEPVPLLRRMREVSRKKVVFSVPKPTPIRAPLRKWRYARNGVPVMFYELPHLTQILKEAGLSNHRVHPLDSGFVVAADLE